MSLEYEAIVVCGFKIHIECLKEDYKYFIGNYEIKNFIKHYIDGKYMDLFFYSFDDVVFLGAEIATSDKFKKFNYFSTEIPGEVRYISELSKVSPRLISILSIL